MKAELLTLAIAVLGLAAMLLGLEFESYLVAAVGIGAALGASITLFGLIQS